MVTNRPMEGSAILCSHSFPIIAAQVAVRRSALRLWLNRRNSNTVAVNSISSRATRMAVAMNRVPCNAYDFHHFNSKTGTFCAIKVCKNCESSQSQIPNSELNSSIENDLSFQSHAPLPCRRRQRIQFFQFRRRVRLSEEEPFPDHVSCSTTRGGGHIRAHRKRSREDQIVPFTFLRRQIGGAHADDSRRTKSIGSFEKAISSCAVSVQVHAQANPI